MLAQGTAAGPLAINSCEQESNPDSSKLGKGPVTPELEQQAANRSRFGLPTPDTTPESVRIVPGHRRKQVFARPGDRRDIALITPSVSSRASSTEEIAENQDHASRSSIHTIISEGASEESSLPSTAPYLDEEETGPSISTVKSIFNSVLSFLNLAKQRKSRADDARVQDTIALIKALPTIKRTRVGNLTRTLTGKQYGEFLRALEDPDNPELRPYVDNLRFDYTRSKKQLEIRMPTTMHGGMEDFIKEMTFIWLKGLKDSQDANVSNAAKTIKPTANANVSFPLPRGPSDTKSPDWRIGHKRCEHRCTQPTLVMEFGWTQGKEDLQAKAEAYMRRSKGKIRTVVGILMRDMYLAEYRNEKRLEQMYLKNELDMNGSYSYCDDEMNKTGEASIIVWRRKILRNGTVKAECYQDEVFRDKLGNPVESISLRLPIQDFICEGIAGGRFQAPELEISSEDLCESINDDLMNYREERGEVVREKAQKEKQERRQREEQEAQENSSRARQARTRGAGNRASRRNEDEGRIMTYGRLVSARLRGQKA